MMNGLILFRAFLFTLCVPSLVSSAQVGDECTEVFSSSVVILDGEAYTHTSLLGRWRGLELRHGVVSVPISNRKRIEVEMPPEIAELIGTGHFLFYGVGGSLRYSLNGKIDDLAVLELNDNTQRVRFSKFHNGSLKVEIVDDDGTKMVVEVPVNERLNADKDKVYFEGEHETTTAIRKRKKFWKRPIVDVEAELRLRRLFPHGQSLVRLLARDNETVVNYYGTTHAEISRILKDFIKNKTGIFVYRGVPYKLASGHVRTFWVNPKNGKKTSMMYTLTNADTGQSISFPEFFPSLVKGGYYGGHGSRDRISPDTIIEVLSFLKSQ